MKRVLTIGSAMHDLFISYEHPRSIELEHTHYIAVPEGKKIEIQNMEQFSGGGSTNAAVSLKKLGFDVFSFFKVGADEAGKFVLADLKKAGITLHSKQTDSAPTGTSYILPSPSGNHPILVHRGANLTITKEDIPWDLIPKVDYIYITSLSGNTSHLLPLIVQYAKKYKIPVITNPGTSQLTAHVSHLQESLPGIDIIIMNAYEAGLLMKEFGINPSSFESPPASAKATAGKQMNKEKKHISARPEHVEGNEHNQPQLIKYLHPFFKKILSHGPHTVVVTNGAEGVYVAHKNQIFFHPSIAPKKIMSTVGAGDAFASCFAGSLMNGHSIEESLRFGVLNSSNVLQYVGAKTGLLSESELKKQAAQVMSSLLKLYKI